MDFRRSDLQEAFFVPGTYALRVYGYGTPDALEECWRRAISRTAPGYCARAI